MIPNQVHGYGDAQQLHDAPPVGLLRAQPAWRRAAGQLRGLHPPAKQAALSQPQPVRRP